MSWELHQAEYRFRVSGEATMPELRDPTAPHFLPDEVVVTRWGRDVRVYVTGPKLGANGKPLKKRRTMTGFDDEDFADPRHPEIPGWLRELYGVVLDAGWER